MSERISGMDDTTFFTTATNPNFSPFVDSAIEKNIIGIHIEGPAVADIKYSNDIPVWGIRQESFFNTYHYRLDRLGILVVSHLKSDAFYVGEAFKRKGKDEPIPPKPESDFRKGYSIDNFVIFPKQHLPSLQWFAGDYLIRLVVFNNISNTIVCNVPEKDFPEAPVDSAIQHNFIQNCSFKKTDASPAIPTRKGIALNVIQERKKTVLYASYTITNYAASSEKTHQSAIPIKLLVTGSDKAEPIILTVDAGRNHAGDRASEHSGFFSFELSSCPDFRIHSRKMAVFAFYKDIVSTPCVFSAKDRN